MPLTLQTCFHRLRKSSMLPLWLGLGAGAIATLPVWGADRIQFFYGPFEATITLEESWRRSRLTERQPLPTVCS